MLLTFSRSAYVLSHNRVHGAGLAPTPQCGRQYESRRAASKQLRDRRRRQLRLEEAAEAAAATPKDGLQCHILLQ